MTDQEKIDEIMDNFDWDRYAKELARSNGLPEEGMIEDRKIARMRGERQKQIDLQQQLEALKQAGGVQALNQPVQPGSMLEKASKQNQGLPVAS